MKNKKVRKGDYGYIRSQKHRRILKTLGLFAIPAVFFIIGLILNDGSKKSIYTVIAIVGCLPACKSCVNLIITLMAHPMKEEVYRKVEKAAGRLYMCYDLYVTSYERSRMIACAAICGEEIACFAPPGSRTTKEDTKAMETFIETAIKDNGYKAHVKLFDTLGDYLQRLHLLGKNRDTLQARAAASYTPPERYPDYSRDELLGHCLCALSI